VATAETRPTSRFTAREQRLEQIDQSPKFDVLIIGGGINGVGLFRDLALQNVSVALVEKTDWCAGTSAASGRVIHGGLRYLENGEFRLVREALHERNRLLKNAPHYVKPLPIMIPVFTWFDGVVYSMKQFLRLQDKPGNRGVFMIKAGLTMYDLFSGRDQPLPRHRFVSKAKSLSQRPSLNAKITSTAYYYDARLTYAERLGWELVREGEAVNPNALGLNYMSVIDAKNDEVVLRDEVSGRQIRVRPKLVVNATGAWIDLTNKALQHETQYIGGTKGSHLVLDYPPLIEAAGDEMVHFVNRDGRILIVYPFFGRVIVGTTDLRADNPDTVQCDEDEVDYLLESVRLVFPDLKPDRSHIVFRFSGIRPLPSQNTVVTGQISRDHSCLMLPPDQKVSFPVYSLVGGKWTTFRAFAEQVTNQLLDNLNRRRIKDTKNLMIGGGANYPVSDETRKAWITQAKAKYGLSADQIDRLLERYGTYANDVMAYIVAGEDTVLEHQPLYSRREIEFIVTNEDVVRLDDLIMRRTLIGLLGELTPPLLDEVAAVTAEVKGWTSEERQKQINHVKWLFATRYGVELTSVGST
jgi:glycerol-3-phosphate dehydrogenase